MKETEDDTNRKKYHVLGIGRINIVKMAVLSKAIYRFSAISTKLLMTFFTELDQKKNLMEKQKPPNSQSNLKKENKELEESGSPTSDLTTKL